MTNVLLFTQENIDMYVIKNMDTKRYVTPPGSEHSYTTNILHALSFPSREQADRYGMCENERVTTVEQEMATRGD